VAFGELRWLAHVQQHRVGHYAPFQFGGRGFLDPAARGGNRSNSRSKRIRRWQVLPHPNSPCASVR
jgi:hypothetical protein